MRSTGKLYILFFLFVIVLNPSFAQYHFEVEAPAVADMNGYFHLKYTINSTDVEKFLPPRMNDFDILSGPSTMVSRDYRIINGKESSSSSTTYTFVLSPLKKGSFVIPPASVVINGKTIRSKSVTVEVSGSGTGRSTSQTRNRQDDQLQPVGSKVTARDLFITVTPSRKKMYEQEAVLLTYKVHSRIGVGLTNIGLSHKPDFRDVVSQELPRKAISSDVERIGNAMYRTGVIMQYIVFPQRAGKLRIPGITFDCSIAQHDSSIDIMDAIFNGGGNVGIMVKRSSPEIVLDVKPLPQPKPVNFSGGVGLFSVKGELLTTNLKTNDVATYRITVSGKGNLKLMRAPKIQFPKDFDAYAPNTKEDLKVTVEGVSGKVIYDYTFVPHNAGKYNLPAVSIPYFDSESEKYASLETPPLRLAIAQGKRTNEDLKHELYLRNSDIRPLKTGVVNTYASGSRIYWWGTPVYWITNFLILISILAMSLWMKKRIKENADGSKRRQKMAGKRVEKRIKECKRILSGGNDTEFYVEISKILSEYFANKFNVGISELNKERIIFLLEKANVAPEVVKECICLWEECEMARFAPIGEVGKKERIYEMLRSVITQIEEKRTVKTPRQSGINMLSGFVLLFIFTGFPVGAQNKLQADSAYAVGNYVEAVRIYEEAVKVGVSSDLYYNMGNAYYRQNDLPRAILNYERALKLEPANSDASYNLELCQSKLADRFDKQSEMFFITWMRLLITGRSTDFWGNCALGCLIIFLLGGMVYWLSQSVFFRKCAFTVALVFSILTIVFQVFAALQWNMYKTERKAVIMETSQSYVSPSASSKKVRVLHEGTTVRIVDEYTKDWYQVEMPDGNVGWIMKRLVEKV